MKRFAWISVVLVCGIWATSVWAFDFQGHRGARGLLPENTLPAFAKALDLGVTTLELDLAVTADGVVVVSHDPRLSPALARTADGKWLEGTGPAIWKLKSGELRSFDVGRIDPDHRYADRFPDQQAIDGTRIPTLKQVFDLVRERRARHVRFNIETKIRPDRPGNTPPPKVFAKAVVDLLRAENMTDRTAVQSFDWRTLAEVQKLAPEIPTVYLSAQQRWLDNIMAGQVGPSPWTAGHDVDKHGGSLPRLVKAAGGAVWSPYWRDLSAPELKEAQALGLSVVVWTVNDSGDMEDLIDMGVDGIITDYPDRLRAILDKRGYRQDMQSGRYRRP